ncbi:MAG: hypothetical protein QNJ72_27640 [Pleurocapsa sp. MO_226.B13]|nr:hypothetical protein [Pleurocapsa sp. MO_226.B13]
MTVEIIIPIAAVIVLLFIFAWLLKVLKASINSILTIAAILIVLQVLFGINSELVIQEVIRLISQIERILIK